MQRKTLTEKLTQKYQLTIRSEENFEEKWFYTFNFATFLVLSTVLVLFLYFLSTMLNWGIAWLTGDFGDQEKNQKLVELALKTDSLAYEVQKKDMFINSLKTVFDGGQAKWNDTISDSSSLISSSFDISIPDQDLAFQKAFEKTYGKELYQSTDGFYHLYFEPIIVGEASTLYCNKDSCRVQVLPNSSQSIKNFEKGKVISLTQYGDKFQLIISHQTGLVSTLNGLNTVQVKLNQVLKRGHVISLNQTDPIIIELSYNGKSIDPLKYLIFE